MNRDLIFNSSKLITTRARQFIDRVNSKISASKNDTATVLREVFSSMKEFFVTLGKPSMKIRKVYENSLPDSSIVNDTFREAIDDIYLMSDEEILLGEAFKRSFNYTSTDKMRLRNKIKRINECVADYIVLADNTISRCMTAQDTFSDVSKVEGLDNSNCANIDTKAGIVSLRIVDSTNRSPGAKVEIKTSPAEYSYPGNFPVAVKKKSASPIDMTDSGGWELLFDITPNSDPSAIVDGNPNTIYEHSMFNVKEEYKKPGATPDTKGYGWDIKNTELNVERPLYYGIPGKDKLDMSILITLQQRVSINWIDFHPYFPSKDCSLIVNEVATSVDGVNYTTCLLDPGDKFMKLNQSSGPDLDIKDRHKYAGHGVWAFPAREAQYVRIDVTCENPYTENIGHLYYEVDYTEVTTHTYFLFFKTHTKRRVEGHRVPGPIFDEAKFRVALERSSMGEKLNLLSSMNVLSLGFIIGLADAILSLFYNTTTSVENVSKPRTKLDIYQDGWRWVVGINGVDINSYKYATSSVLITRDFIFSKPVKEVSLSVSEFVPHEFYQDDISAANKWIKYFISVDHGATWHQISPLERNLDLDTSAPPKVICVTVGDSEPMIENKTYVSVPDEVYSVKLMAEISRPSDYDSITPMLYDYKIRIVPRESGDE